MKQAERLEMNGAPKGPFFALDGKVAWVTGSSRGIGLAVASKLAFAGAHVIFHGRDRRVVDEIAEEMVSKGCSASSVAVEMTDEDGVIAALDGVISRHGRLDILVNNAGKANGSPLINVETADWRALIDVNLTACFVLAREAGRRMSEQREGRIINIASVAGLLAAKGRVGYVASKHALIGLTRSLALELGGLGVTSNAIAPGFIATDMTKGMQRDPQSDAWVRSRNPQARWGTPEDVAYAALFLASPEAAFINGAVLCVDGGMSACVL